MGGIELPALAKGPVSSYNLESSQVSLYEEWYMIPVASSDHIISRLHELDCNRSRVL